MQTPEPHTWWAQHGKAYLCGFPVWMKERRSSLVEILRSFPLLTWINQYQMLSSTYYIKVLIKEWSYQTKYRVSRKKKKKHYNTCNNNNCIEQSFKNKTHSGLEKRFQTNGLKIGFQLLSTSKCSLRLLGIWNYSMRRLWEQFLQQQR